MLVCMVGGISLVMRWVPVEAALGILLWIGLIMTAQAFQTVPKSHALAVGLGLIPALAGWALLLIETALRVAGQSLFQAAPKFGSDLYIHGVIALSQGFMLSSMVLSAMLAHVIDRKFMKASVWCGLAAVLSLTGLIHAYELTERGVQNKFGFWAAPAFAFAYALGALVLLALHAANRKQSCSKSESMQDQEASPIRQ